jgi:hypothetical protein
VEFYVFVLNTSSVQRNIRISTFTLCGKTPCSKTAGAKRIINLLSEIRIRGVLPLCSQ